MMSSRKLLELARRQKDQFPFCTAERSRHTRAWIWEYVPEVFFTRIEYSLLIETQ